MENKRCNIEGTGFTLIEVIVTMIVISIAASIAIPTFSRWLPNYAVKNAARDVFSNLQLAKLEAVKRGASCIITIDTTANTYKIKMKDDTEIKSVSLADYGNDGTTFDTAYSTDTTITFLSRGMAEFASGNSKGYVYITNAKGSAHYVVAISSVGSLSIQKL